MILFVLGCLLGLVAVAMFVVAKAYGSVPLTELRRRSRKGDQVATLLFRSASYGIGAKVVLGLIGLISLYFAFVCLVESVSEWLAVPVLLVLAVFGFFAVQSRGGVHEASVLLAAKASPAIAWLVERVHPLVDAVGRGIKKLLPIRFHSGLYEKEDLVNLLEAQKKQPDNRIKKGEIDLLIHALSFGDKHVSNVLIPRRVVKSVSADETYGPVLMGELHATGFSRFPVYEEKEDKVVGTLYMYDLIAHKNTGKIRDIMRRKVVYVHENFTLYQTLQAFIKTKHHLFVVVNDFEEYVGIITIEDVLEEVIGRPIVDEFDKYDDLRAVASALAKKEHNKAPHAPESSDDTKK